MNNVTVLEHFLHQVAINPEKEALVSHKGTITYRELNEHSNRIANFLIGKGIGKDNIVPLLTDRSSLFIVGVLGIMKAGAAYIPIDDSYPDKRKAYIIGHSGVSFALSTVKEDKYQNTFDIFNIESIIHTASYRKSKEVISLQQPAYVIFTSGTTGNPKGVVVEHHALETIVSWHNQNLAMTSESRSTLMAGIGFDVAQLEIWSALIVGGTIYLPNEETRLNPQAMIGFFAHHRLSHAFVPTALVKEIAAITLPENLCLRYLFTAGEKLGPVITDNLPYVLVDYYGPTEATIFATCNWVRSANENPPASIGFPIADTEIFILDESLSPVAPGEIGEIFIAGSCLARGYLNNVLLTREKFIIHPIQGKRLYRSGDLARRLPDGAIQYLGRQDDQIKIRGNRIDLSEIEEAIAQYPEAKEVSVLAAAVEDMADKQILAFIVSDLPELEMTKLKNGLRETLPDYMVPSVCLLIDKIPLNSNGKIDRDALLAYYQAEKDKAQPEFDNYSENERKIAAIWQRLLGHCHFSLYDSFFDVGGHSLLAARLMREISQQLDVKTWIRDIYENNSISALAQAMMYRKRSDLPQVDSEPVRELQKEVHLPKGLKFNAEQGKERLVQPQHILLTGVTGLIGAHLLVDLLATTSAMIHCPVRARHGADNIWQRFIGTVEKYRIQLSAHDRARIKLYKGDLAQPRLGMGTDVYATLSQTVDVIYHSASAVNFIQPYSYMRRDNVQGLTEILRFSANSKTKPLILLSTISVYSWGHLYTHKQEMREGDDIDQNIDAVITDIGYVRSKWVMEKIADLAAAAGLPLMTFRLGYAMCHSKTGICASYQWWGRLVKTCITQGNIPNLVELREGLTTVDYMTAAIAHISRDREALGKKFNLIHTADNNLTLKSFFRLLEKTFSYQFTLLPFHYWLRQWEHNIDAPLYPLLSLFKDNMYDGKSTVELYQHTYLWNCDNVKQFLRGSGITEPVFTKTMLQAYLDYLQVAPPKKIAVN